MARLIECLRTTLWFDAHTDDANPIHPEEGPMRTYQLFIAPSDSIVGVYDNPRYEAAIIGGHDGEVITVQATSEDTIELPPDYTDYTVIELLEIPPQEFTVGDTAYMEWFCTDQLQGDHILVSSIAGWYKERAGSRSTLEAGQIGWSEPQPIKGTRKYLVTLPEGLSVSRNGCLSWSKGAVVQVVEVLS